MFFLDLPNGEERRQALSNCLRICLQFTADTALMNRLVDSTRGFSYADIEYAVKDLAEEVLFERGGAFEPESLLTTFADTIPISRRSPEMTEEIRSGARSAHVPHQGVSMSNSDLRSQLSSYRSELSAIQRENARLQGEINAMTSAVAAAEGALVSTRNHILRTLETGNARLIDANAKSLAAYELQGEIAVVYERLKRMELANKKIRECNNTPTTTLPRTAKCARSSKA